MKKLKKFGLLLEKYPLIYSTLVLLLFFILTNILVLTLFPFKNLINNKNLLDFIALILENISTITIIFIFKGSKYFKKTGFFKTFKMGFFLFLATAIPIMLNIYDSIYESQPFKPILEIFLGIIQVFTIGFFEESVFRGLISNAFARKYAKNYTGIIKSVIFANLIFGAAHITNTLEDINLQYTILQSVGAFFIGCCFSAIYFRGGNIFVLIFIHAIIDANGLFALLFLDKNLTLASLFNKESGFSYLIVVPIFLTYTWILLRKSKTKEIENVINYINK